MFDANKANRLSTKAINRQLTTWEQLQNDIRQRAYRGYDYLYLTNRNYLNLFTTLEVAGYKISWDQEQNLWYVHWDFDGEDYD